MIRMSSADSIIISSASTPEDLTTIRHLFSAYVAALPISVAYQNFTHELASLPGKYCPTAGGALLLARSSVSGAAIGCVALRSLRAPLSCEMKRLYVSEEGRGLGTGKKLLARAVQCARELGYKEMVLDTLPSMGAARGIYREFGFREIEAYYATPVVGTIFLGLTL
jgi:GNAT superfamily N-acetyltransferase